MRRVSIKISVLIVSILSFVILAQADSSNIESSFDEYETRKLIEKSEPIFKCSLPPEKYSVYRLGEGYEDGSAVFIEMNNYTTLVKADVWEVEGTGVCRFQYWVFDYKGTNRLSDLGCYGETFPPENAKGEIIINGPGEYSRSYYCY